jgi:hypothetical protein
MVFVLFSPMVGWSLKEKKRSKNLTEQTTKSRSKNRRRLNEGDMTEDIQEGYTYCC